MRILNKLSMLTVEVALLSVGITNAAQAASFISTDQLENREGNSRLGFLIPFPSRFQQVYDASQFGSAPIEISQIALRPDESNTTPFDFTIEDIEFYLSTTTRDSDALSSVFEENISANYTKVFDGEWKASSENIGLAGSPKNFDIVLNFTKPFIYDPREGNLLLEYKKFTPEITGNRFDSEFVLGDSVSTVIAAGDANAVNANPRFSSTLGLATQFKVTAIPEPSSFISSILVASFLGISKLKTQRSRQNKEN
ncbi:hypothetical protein [Nostoc punctiforme]|uniref:PEP-CTERM protein-sorting domain-containing protein n=1 Tax=Nostoc punctiforme (strain ATCC 29133 / PCC 73102) TaxID=63737 RepID=B2J533_NOSP7|nr:hypothetical protein [Nostoc punctiforme]ACC80693.1 hypothetical protein Npun_R2074 [Nostoc punctiforme PCC 73102]